MGQFFRGISIAAGALALLLPGCQWPSQGQLSEAQSQNRALTEQAQAQQQEIENLKAHNRAVENQLIQAEEELAEMDQRLGVDRKQIANFQHERRTLRGQVETIVNNARGSRGSARDLRLEELSRRYDWLAYDPETGISRFDIDVLFDSGGAELHAAARESLDDLVRFLKSPEAAELRVMIVGHTDSRQIKRPTRDKYPDNWHLSAARALAVADYLRKHGVPDDRLGVAGYGQHQSIADNETAEDRQTNRRVEVFVMGPETPVVGWTETTTSIY
ncbi:MAG TPA: OmpA family protein [Pirellulales bacterium]|nr:OmpA family protein [Pirellulales bacterium]